MAEGDEDAFMDMLAVKTEFLCLSHAAGFVTDDDFALALREVRPMFGTDFDPAMVAFLAAHGARDDDALEGARGLKRECVDVELIRAMGAADVDGLPGIPYGVKVRIKRSL